MKVLHRIRTIAGLPRIEIRGRFFAEDELIEEHWLVSMELRVGLRKREKVEAERQIAQLEARISALRSAGV